MNKLTLAAAAVLVIAGGTRSSAREDNRRNGVPSLLEFRAMTGVAAPYLNPGNPIRGINGGGVPWVVSSAKGALRADGKLEIALTGLVLEATGANPVPQFRAIVSCLSRDGSGSPTTVNVATDPFDATTGFASTGGGDARLETFLKLPTPCIAPIVFVTNAPAAPAPTRWFAATRY
jgi:hypothetical protein